MKHRWCSGAAGILFAGAMAIQFGPTTTQQAVDQMNASSMRGVPTPPPAARPAPRPDSVWVPDRWLSVPGAPASVFEQGHWAIYTPEGGRIAPPPPRPDATGGP
jgi:hypothetical protein